MKVFESEVRITASDTTGQVVDKIVAKLAKLARVSARKKKAAVATSDIE